MTRAEVSEKIARMKAVQRGLVKAVGSDYNDQRRFQVREIEVNGKVVSRLMKIDTNLKYLPRRTCSTRSMIFMSAVVTVVGTC